MIGQYCPIVFVDHIDQILMEKGDILAGSHRVGSPMKNGIFGFRGPRGAR
jgi:hypothetical protein